jgi:hypothetical protein
LDLSAAAFDSHGDRTIALAGAALMLQERGGPSGKFSDKQRKTNPEEARARRLQEADDRDKKRKARQGTWRRSVAR